MPNSGARGFRNNNPANIRKSATKWKGKVGNDGAFEQFDTMRSGLRAGIVNFRNKLAGVGNGRWNKHTISEVIHILSPAADSNDPVGYSGRLAAAARTTPHAPLDWTNREALARMFYQLVIEENGAPLNLSFVRDALTGL